MLKKLLLGFIFLSTGIVYATEEVFIPGYTQPDANSSSPAYTQPNADSTNIGVPSSASTSPVTHAKTHRSSGLNSPCFQKIQQGQSINVTKQNLAPQYAVTATGKTYSFKNGMIAFADDGSYITTILAMGAPGDTGMDAIENIKTSKSNLADTQKALNEQGKINGNFYQFSSVQDPTKTIDVTADLNDVVTGFGTSVLCE